MVIKRLGSIFLLPILCSYIANAQIASETMIYSSQVKSLQLRIEGETEPLPVIDMAEGTLDIFFDILNYSQGRYAYSIIYCDADWKKSTLSNIEYMDGFQGMTIDDYAQSITTTTLYRNYHLSLPNDDIRFKISGNYLLEVYEEDNPQKILFTARFAVIDPRATITGIVKTNTDITLNKEHQQIDFDVNYKNIPISNPQTDIKVFVFQNNRIDNIKTGFRPQTIAGNIISYKYNPELVFEAGNEFRRIEFMSHRFSGMRIERIQYFNPYYHADVMTDRSRARRSYQYDQDQNGRYYVNCTDCNDPDTEADYYIVHFTYETDLLPKGDLYLNGDLVQNRLDESSRMEYNAETGLFEKALLLKQGHYNYQYLFIPKGETLATPAITEGNYYQTENEYTILVYYRQPGGRYDQLVGKQVLRYKQ